MYCSMKMSLCNTFRLFFITSIVLSIIDPHSAFTLRRTTTSDSKDLAQEESVILEVKHDLKRLNDVPIDLLKATNVIKPDDLVETTMQIDQTNMVMTSSSDFVLTTEASTEETETVTQISEPMTESTTQSNEFTESTDVKTDIGILITKESNSLPVTSNTFSNSGTTIQESKELTIYETTRPVRKQYTTIERIRTTPTTPTSISEETENSIKIENISKAEKQKHSRVSLQDTSDIGSLEKLKIELLLTTMKQKTTENQPTLTPSTDHTGPDEVITSIFTNSPTFGPTESNKPSVPKYSVESKRAGYLDFSSKTTADEKSAATAVMDFKTDEREPLRAMFEVENETDIPDEKTDYRVESQSQLSEDALKEELLKEDIINNNEENAKRFQEDSLTTQVINLASETQINRPQNSAKNVTSLDDKLKVKPINMITEKNTILYPVNPNYKPLKKIDVQPPKLFLRDPDDNTWRNESLSSLGIVFKPKNSSKSFTQVLKNKTESEWNNLSEKDNKSDTPDLRERLQKMAEMRKSKKKKIDSFGNIVYFDYEENNDSGEIENQSKEETNKVINATTPIVSSYVSPSSESSKQLAEISTTSTIEAAFAKEFRVSSTEKPKRFFNVPEYYDSMDDEDIDYLNMAKIDIKKFPTSRRTSTTVKQTWPALGIFDKQTHTTFPDRKATVQFFPPLKIQKSNINDYDNNFKVKVNSYTTMSERPKYVLPVSTTSTSTMTSEYRNRIPYSKQQDINKNNQNDFSVATKPNLFKDLYLTRSPITTDAFTSPGDGGDGYVIKHYRDFVNEAARDADYDKNMNYSPYTDVPVQGVTKTETGGYEKHKSKINMGDDYDDDAQFRKDVLQRFVNNFNHNTHRFKSDFPVLFNNSVIHSEVHNGRDIASSRAFMRGLYENRLKPKGRACDPNCDNLTVELSPAYELHYYVPDQEEKQEAVPPATAGYTDM